MFKIVFVVFGEYRGMSRRKMSSLENIETCLEGRYQKHEQVGNKYLWEESLMIQHKALPWTQCNKSKPEEPVFFGYQF